MKHPVICFFGIETIPENQFNDQDVMTILAYPTDSDLQTIVHSKQPDVIVTLGDSWKPFQKMATADFSIRRRWLHYQSLDKVPIRQIHFCYLSNMNKQIISFPVDKKPLVSCFTPSYKSGHKISRPLRSLKAQNYPYWEWIIVNDSPENPENWELLKSLKAQDARIRIYQSDQNIANIGQLKYESASLARGQILVELDHDDDLTVDCLGLLVEAFDQYPEAGFAYTDFAELQEETLAPFQYGSRWAFGYGGYYAEMTKIPGITDKVLSYVATSVNLNQQTIRNIVGVPNHIRAWRTKFYQEIGGHLPMAVADDYELLVRTFLKTRMVHIPYLGYYQYRNQSGNTTFRRNALITMLQGIAKEIHEPAIQARLIELGIDKQPACHQPAKRLWEQPFDYQEPHASLKYRNPRADKTISVVMATYKRPILLRRALDSVFAQTHQDFEILLVGDNCPDLDQVVKDYWQDSRLRWWNLQDSYNDGGASPRNYALRMMLRTPWVAYLDDDNYWLPNHLESLFKAIQTGKEPLSDASKTSNVELQSNGPSNQLPRFAFSSFIMYQDPATIQAGKEPFEYTVICRQPKRYRLDTSSFLHHASLLKEYGYWKPLKQVGRAHDWDLICRWLGQDYHGNSIKIDEQVSDRNEKVSDRNEKVSQLFSQVQVSEPWVATGEATLVYRVVPTKMNARGIYDYYHDQPELPTDANDPKSLGNLPRLINLETNVLATNRTTQKEVPQGTQTKEVPLGTQTNALAKIPDSQANELVDIFESDPETISSDDEKNDPGVSKTYVKPNSIGSQGQITKLTPELIEKLKLPKSPKQFEKLLRPRGAQEIFSACASTSDSATCFSASASVSTSTSTEKNTQVNFCLTTLHCQDREPIFSLISSFIEHTSTPLQSGSEHSPVVHPCGSKACEAVVPWIILAQGCTVAHLERLQSFLANLEVDWLEFQIKIVDENLGCSKGHDLLAELAKDYYYVMLLEDDWVCQPESRTQAPKSWLKTCLTFLETNPQVSTLFLRHYLTEDEKSKSGWGRHIPYRCHKKTGNFNYRRKLNPETIQNINGVKFQAIPNFLFTFNPCIRRNPDYYRVKVYPLDICDDRSAEMGGWKSSDHKNVSNWGWSEAWAMEKTYDLITYNVARGLFSHYEHLELFLEKQVGGGAP